MPRIVDSLRVGVLLALATLAVVGCDLKERANADPARDLWTASGDAIRNRATDLRGRQQALVGRIAALSVPDGTEDAALAAAITELQGTVGSLDQACGAAERVLAQATSETEVALSKPNKLAAQKIVENGLASFEAAAGAAKSALEAVTPKVDNAEALMKRLQDGVAAEVKRLADLAATGGAADFADLGFLAGTADFDFTHPATKATLGRLVTFARSCDELRFGLTGHTSREGKPAANKALSLARAEAIKQYLVSAGIAAAKIVKTEGLGSDHTMVDEPEPGTPAEAEMAPDELEARRRKNRRITVLVTAPCTTPAAAPTATPPIAPPPAGDAIPPGAPRGVAPGSPRRTAAPGATAPHAPAPGAAAVHAPAPGPAAPHAAAPGTAAPRVEVPVPGTAPTGGH